MSDLRKTVLITGCSPGGIGHTLAHEFHNRGARVFATARSAQALSDLTLIGIETFSLDVNDHNSILDLKSRVQKLTHSKLDYLINNAGRNYTVPALDIDIDEVRLTFETNVIAVINMCQAFAPLLIEAKGTIVQIGSVSGIMPYVFGSVYNASKAALHQYSNTLRVELAPFGVNVVTIITGGVQSRIAREDRRLPVKSYYEPIVAEYEQRVTHSQEGAMPRSEYCKQVVDQVWGRNSKSSATVWAGAKVWTVWVVMTFCSQRMQDTFFARIVNLKKLENYHRRVR